MRRNGLGYGALAVSIVFVFAPRPAGGSSSLVGAENESLFSRVLAPTVDTVDVRERNAARAVAQTAPLWLVLSVAFVALPRLLALFSLPARRPRRPRDRGDSSHACRAPPVTSV